MDPRRTFAAAIALVLIAVLMGCATPDRRADNPDRSRLGVLIIAGEGLNSRYDDLKASSVLFTVSQKFAESLHAEIEKRGTKAQLYVNRDRNIETRKYVAELFADKKRDGLVQVTVTHVKNGSENTIYLSAGYSPLQWRQDAKGESFVTGSGPVAKYKLLGDGTDGRNTPLTVFAREFAENLFKSGYIGGD
jgi:hypothetical protein